ncbi:four-carbon acid sugar kinase family protein [Sporomusa sphaeroides]|uniref:four-carbon acid sugar kinase family protein n=1 Tax=Sporomusa sphaeroides TaxID=47679 RepID=UPI002C504B94|nr:four-carbon acid sugar kinase family protein [Sporomusa sphaeroides]HML33258.1 four-carbon acid sugar kinase family protein [Sporomusa sphaeroides]
MMKSLPNLSVDRLKSYPKIDENHVALLLQQAVAGDPRKIIVLDDDPTGTQTVHDISVYTDWTYESVSQGFREKNKVFYILTNSRGFTEEQTSKAHRDIGAMIARVAGEQGRDYLIVSRSDSTLRGHYPLETMMLQGQWEHHTGKKVDGEIICPYFKEGGRFTIDNIHYVQYGDKLVPAGETEFAKDKTFGYTSSDLPSYIEEKSRSLYKKEDVVTISLQELRALNIQGIADKLIAMTNFGKVVVNAIDACDVQVFCIALYRAMAQGKQFLFRTAAGFVKELGAITDKPLLTRREMIIGDIAAGGIVVVGSHTQKTTRQLEELKTLPGIQVIEFNSDLVLEGERFQAEIASVVRQEEELLRQGTTVVVHTKRRLLSLENDSPQDALARSLKISEAVQSLVGRLQVTPAFIVAKGGITSSDVGTKALKIKRANVLGQIRPGIPVWKTGAESKFPQIPFIIFPGNVGEQNTLKEAIAVLLEK